MTTLKDFGAKVKNKRVELQMTQEELAKRVGYTSRSSINKIELGLVDLPQSKIIAIASALQVTPFYLVNWGNQNNGVNNGIIGDQNHNNVITLDPFNALSPVDSAIITIVKNLNEKQKGEVLSFCAALIGKKGE